jgi:hypothetical protein
MCKALRDLPKKTAIAAKGVSNMYSLRGEYLFYEGISVIFKNNDNNSSTLAVQKRLTIKSILIPLCNTIHCEELQGG